MRRPHRPLSRAILFDGDSLTWGTASTGGQSYPAQVMALLARSDLAWVNYGIPGETIVQMLAGAPANLDAYYGTYARPNIAVYWGGTNDLYNGGSATTIYNNIVAYGQARRTAGLKVVVLTMLPRTQAGEPFGFETNRQTINANIRANLATFADQLADVGNDANIGQAGDQNSPTYYSGDGVHLNNTGYGVVAGYVKTALTGLL